MASYTIHKAVAADSFNGIKLTTPSDINVSHTSTKVSITIPQGTYMHLHTSTQYFNFNYCAFVAVKFKDKDGKTLSTIPDLSSGTELSKMLVNSGGAIEDTDYYPKKAAFTEFSSNVLLFHKGQQESDGIQYGNSSPWTSHKLAEAKTITVSIPDKATSYTIYIAGCTMNTTTYRRYAYDPYYRAKYSPSHPYGESNWEIPTWMNTNMGSGTAYIGGNSCKHSHAFLDKDETGTVIEKDLTSGPLGNDIRTYLKWDVTQQKYVTELVTNKSLTQDMGTPTVATDNANNTFSAIIRPFKPGKNNPINKIFGILEFRKDNNPIGEFCEVPKGMSFRPQVWGRAYLDATATSGYFMTEDVTKDTPYRCIGVYEAAKENGKTIYKELTTLHDQNNELTSSDTKKYYRRVTQNSTVKRFYFESHPGVLTLVF